MSEGWFSDLEDHENRVYSQSGEDGSLIRLFDLIGESNRFFVEFGAKDGRVLSNTANLRLNHGWTGLLMEGDPACGQQDASELYADETDARVRQEIVTRENFNELLGRYRVPKSFDLLCIDIDGNDYWVWKALDGYRPRVVVIEYNIFFALAESKTIPYDPTHEWDKSAYHGASLAALRKLGSEKGYELVYTDSFAPNAFFVAKEELPADWSRVPIGRAARWGEFAERPDPFQRAWLDV
jgi:hypothetical protein